jgi:hypothetical protein
VKLASRKRRGEAGRSVARRCVACDRRCSLVERRDKEEEKRERREERLESESSSTLRFARRPTRESPVVPLISTSPVRVKLRACTAVRPALPWPTHRADRALVPPRARVAISPPRLTHLDPLLALLRPLSTNPRRRLPTPAEVRILLQQLDSRTNGTRAAEWEARRAPPQAKHRHSARARRSAHLFSASRWDMFGVDCV